MRTTVNVPNKEWYLNRCTALERALKHKEVMPPFLIVSLCQGVMVRAIGTPWRVVWFLFLERLEHDLERLKSHAWWTWHTYVRLRTHDEIIELYEVWLEKEVGYDCREWPNEITIDDTETAPAR